MTHTMTGHAMTGHALTESPDLNIRLSRWLAPLAAVLAALCVVAGVKIALLLLSPVMLPRIDFPASPPSSPAVSLYPAAASAGVDNLAQASIDARLLGVAGVGDRMVATVAVSGGREQMVAVGGNLADGVTVENILPRALVVREHGTLRRIAFRPLGGVQPGALVEAVSLPTAADDRPLSTVEATLVSREDGSSGLRIDHLGDDLATLALVAAGDVVVAVDGRPLDAALADPGLLAAAAAGDAVAITLIRAGTELDLEVDGALVRRLLAQ